jgi:hypothetical protein
MRCASGGVSEWSTLFDTAMLTLLAARRCSCSSSSIPGSGDGAQPAARHFGTDSRPLCALAALTSPSI